jgi:fucose permease
VWLHITGFFVYTGLESSVGQWCFTLLSEKRGLGVEAAGSWTAAYWASLTAGRIALGFVVDRIGPDRMLRAASAGAVLGALAFAWSSGFLGCAGLLVLGASLAPVYPTLMARTPARLGTGIAAHAVGFQVSAATLGSTIAPALVGVLVARTDASAIGVTAACLAALFVLLHERLLRLSPRHEKAPSDERTFVA